MTDNGGPLQFGPEMNALRIERGLSWEELARRANVSATYLKDIHYGRRGHGWPSEPVVAAVAAALEVPLDAFLLARARAVLATPAAIDAAYRQLRAS